MFAQTDLNNLVLDVRSHMGPLCVVGGMWCLIVLALGIVLRTAISLFNGLAGGKDSAEGVPVPSLLGSMAMVFVSFLVTFGLCFAILWTAANLALSVNLNPAELTLYSTFGSILLFFLVLSVLLALFLPAPIFRAGIIAVLCVPVGIVLFILLSIVIWLISLALDLSFPAFQHLPFLKR